MPGNAASLIGDGPIPPLAEALGSVCAGHVLALPGPWVTREEHPGGSSEVRP